ncbi:MAG: phosphoglucomutase/phosphomannomutase family protein [Aquificota bacterium]|nr:MAG: phosphoglucomutase/phosphomannomutase family protein [Aquificota bacterium]
MIGKIAMAGKIRFGTDGWRGVIAEDFTFANLLKIAQAAGIFMIQHWQAQEKGVVVGYDTRFLSPHAAWLTAEALEDMGISVTISPGPVPTPILSFSVKRKDTAGGIMITASHNPYMFNGFKIKSPQGGSASPQVTKEVERLVEEVPQAPLTHPGTIDTEDLISPYLAWLEEAVDIKAIGKAPFTLVSDAIHGAVGNLFYRILSPWGLRVEVMAAEPNPLFGGRDPEPIERNLGSLMARIKKLGGKAVGVANDGDGDRLGMVDEEGSFVSPHRLLALVIDHLYRNKGMRGEVVKTFSTTSMIDKMGKDFGITVHETAIGFKYILPLMLERDILVGGEESGGIGVKGHIPERDGIYSALLILEKMMWEGKSLALMVKELEDRYGPHIYRRRDLKIPQEKARKVVEKVTSAPPEKLGPQQVEETKVLDGVKLLFQGGGWLLFRASGTEPLLRLYCEGATPQEVKTTLDHGERLVRELTQP